MAERQYIAVYFLVFLVLLAGVAGLNYWVNPYAAFRSLDDVPFIDHQSRLGTRIAKAEVMRRYEYDTLLLGTSRTLIGLNPDSEWLPGKSAYNAGFRAGRVVEMELALNHAIRHQPIKDVFLFLDFSMFRVRELTSIGVYDTQLNPELDRAKYYADMLLSYSTLRYSLRAIRDAISGSGGDYTLSGWKKIPSRDDAGGNPRQRFDVILETFVNDRNGFFTLAKYDEEQMEILRRMTQTCADNDIRLVIAFSPFHATFSEAVYQSGKWDVFEEIKKKTTEMAAEVNPDTEVWDFAVFTPETEEPIGDARVRGSLQYYSEGSHFNSTLGNLVLRRVYGDGEPSHFGVLMTPENIDAHLADVRADRERWAAENPMEVERIRLAVSGVPPQKLPKVLAENSETRNASEAID